MKLHLEDGTIFEGKSFGAPVSVSGEVVFNTGMTGYVESLSDPSYAGQIVVLTYPLIGNYGVPHSRLFESEKMQIAGLVVGEYSEEYSHHAAEKSLAQWLKDSGVPAVTGVDTRALTKRLREHGVMLGQLVSPSTKLGAGDPKEFTDPNEENLVARVSIKKKRTYGNGPVRIVAVDCGMKENIVRSLVRPETTVIRVPWNYDFTKEKYDALFISNGPGDPTACGPTIRHIKQAMADGKPILGICLGNQLLALAAGASTYKLKYGHRSQNQPCIDLLGRPASAKASAGRCYITSQNHGFAVDAKSLPAGWSEWFTNANDGSNEGIRHATKLWMSVQFHPEASPGPTDTAWIFDEFLSSLNPDRFGRGSDSTSEKIHMTSKPKKVLLLGSGGLKIGQAGEFDYSGSQAIKALKEEGIKVVLINPNIATVQTDPPSPSFGRASEKLADTVYFLPLTETFATQVIQKEKPDGILLGFGGQTALNLGLALEKSGVLKKYRVRVLGTPVSTIRDTEDRDLFVRRLKEIGAKTARSRATKNVAEALEVACEIGYPVMLRSGFALGGEGSGMVRNAEELSLKLTEVFHSVPQVLIEEYLGGWKEIEYEVVRDRADNCITVCNMENLDPMGIHTGESMVVAPSQTLSNEEYHTLREISIRTIRHLGVVGECNIQYALHPKTGDYRVIEVNARLSRSSALASKATGYPLAFVAAKLALGYTLPEIKNSVTKTTTACFEPALDYLVLKMPRWDLAKFENATPHIGTEMKSVGEVMAIGRSFEEVLQKALRMLSIGAYGFTAQKNGNFQKPHYLDEIKHPTTTRIFALAEALRAGVSVEKIHGLSGIDPWFLEKMKNIIYLEKKLKRGKLNAPLLRNAKCHGFSDAQIAVIRKSSEEKIRTLRKRFKVLPWVKQIDTLAGEFPARTNYLYLTYHGEEHDVERGKNEIAVLGSGSYCIGSSVEFDWSCVQALKSLKREGYGTIMINYNPETVSTDYDMSDRLYFDELSLERVLDIVEFEQPKGVVVSTGGQIPNNLALKLHRSGIPVLGTSPEDIDRAEDRHAFSKLLDRLKIDQPLWAELTTPAAAVKTAEKIGYPVLVRPSYVLSGAAMNVALDRTTLIKFLKRATDISSDHPVVISKFIENAREIEIDGVAAKGVLAVYAITEHVENAGTHSGDATVVLPPQRTYLETIRQAKKITKRLVKELKITGPFNIQFLAKDNRLQVIECNVRASRSFPFVSKVTGYNFIDIATRALLKKDISGDYRTLELDYVAVKSPQFSYSRIKGADPTSGVEMASTGEVACFGDSYGEALLKSMLAAGFRLPKKNILVSLGKEENKVKLLPPLQLLSDMGFKLYATEQTADFLSENNVPCKKVYKISTKKDPNVLSLISKAEVDLIVNIPTHAFVRESTDGFIIRRKAVDMNIPLITNRQLAEAFITALAEHKGNGLKAKPWSEYQ